MITLTLLFVAAFIVLGMTTIDHRIFIRSLQADMRNLYRANADMRAQLYHLQDLCSELEMLAASSLENQGQDHTRSPHM